MTEQPKWRCVANLGDVNPFDYGGYFVFIDETGVYDPEMEVLEVPDGDIDYWESFRFIMEPCTYREGILSDNKFHPGLKAWFAHDVPSMCSTMGWEELEFLTAICSNDVVERAQAWRVIYDYWGAAHMGADTGIKTKNKLMAMNRFAKAMNQLKKQEEANG